MPDANARAAVLPGGDLLDPAVVQPDGEPDPLLDEQLREVAAAEARGAKDLRGEIAVEHGGDASRAPSRGRLRVHRILSPDDATAKAHGQVLYFDGRKIRWTRPGVPCPPNGIEIRTPRQFDEVPRMVKEAMNR